MPQVKPLVSYYGGKQRMASKILPLFPPHSIYAEPFCGGAALLFKKPVVKVSNTHHYREVLNDTNNLLINLYQIARDKPEELNSLLQLTLYSKHEHDCAKNICKNPDKFNDVEKAWAMYVNLNQSFANISNAGWGRSKINRNFAATWKSRKLNLEVTLERLSEVHLDNIDALSFIKTWDSDKTLFYVDPPYPNTDQGRYSGYSQEDFDDLIELLKTIKGSFVLSGYDNDAVPSDWVKHEFKATMTASKKKPNIGNSRVECVWVVDRSLYTSLLSS